MIKNINIANNVLRFLEAKDKNIYNNSVRFIKYYLLPTCEKEKLTWFISCLCQESSFLNANKRYPFNEEISRLASICNYDLNSNQIKILSDLIGNFHHKFRSHVAVERLYAIDDLFVLELVNLLIDGKVKLDTHISVRADLVFYSSVHEFLPYDIYKKLVFSTICRTTVYYCNGNFNQPFNPMEKVRNKAWLEDKDYKQLCKEIFSKTTS